MKDLKALIYLNGLVVYIFQNEMYLWYPEKCFSSKEKCAVDICSEQKCVIKDNYDLNKGQGSSCAPFCSGTLPPALEIGRFNDTPEEGRFFLLLLLLLSCLRRLEGINFH